MTSDSARRDKYMRVVNAKEMQSIDQTTIHDIGIPGIVLMENAGRGVVDHIALLAEAKEVAI